MGTLRRDFRKVENLVNRGIVLIRHLELILNEVTRKARATGQSVRVDNSARLYDILYSCNAFLKSLSDVLKDVIRIHESTKEQIAEFEKRM